METESHATIGGSKIFLNPNGWIEANFGKTLNKTEYLQLATWLYDMSIKIGDEGRATQLLIDFSRLEEITPDTEKLAYPVTKALNFERMAGFGIHPGIKGSLDSVKIHSSKSDAIREFHSREEAEAWLLSK